MSAEVQSGYKQTEVGLIPEDWEVKNLGECLASTPRYGINAAAVPYSDRLPVYIRITDISTDGRFAPEKLVSVDNPQTSNYYLLDGDIVLARTGASVGKSYKYDTSDGPLVFAGFLILIRPNPTKLVSSYIASYLSTKTYWDWVGVMSTRSGQPGINGKEYSQLPLPIPSISEQREISITLSDIDNFVKNLDKLIAKKRDIQQAAMQQLLTGQRRLPGFSGAWDKVAIGDYIDLLTGFPFPSSHYSSSGIRLLRGSNVKRGQTDWGDDLVQYWPSLTSDIAKYELAAGDLVIAMDGSLVGRSFARLDESDLPAVLLQRVARIRSKTIDIGFLTHQIASDLFVSYCDSVKTVTAIPHISSADIRGFVIPLPPTLEEQTAIAIVLSDMGTELATLETRRDKARQLKQGMMQELLTGRVRLA